MNERENCLRTIRFQGPEWIPCSVYLTPAIWKRYGEKLEEVVLRHPSIFGEYRKGRRDFEEMHPACRSGECFTDMWGCVWYNLVDGIRGQVKIHPLRDWDKLRTFRPPDPFLLDEVGPRKPWDVVQREVLEMRRKGKMTWGHSSRYFERLHFLRGFKNLMIDLMTSPPQLEVLKRMVLDHNITLIRKWLEIGVDGIRMGDDLGTQKREMMSPAVFRRHLLPGYTEMCQVAREGGCETYMHSDGHILGLLDPLIEAGFTVINPQLSANGIDQLAARLKGRICIDADVDRQRVLPRGKPRDVKNHIAEIVKKLGSKEGGLMIIAGVYPDVPLENIEALCEAMEEHMYI